MALKFPRRRIRNADTHNIQDMNDALLPVVEEMGRLNEHNFNQSMQAELAITDMAVDVAFNTQSGSHVVDVSDKGIGSVIATALAAGSLHRIPQDNRWNIIWPDKLSKSISSREGGMFRILAGAQWGSERIAYVSSSSYLIFALRVDGANIPDSVIGDQDSAQEHAKMERGKCGQLGSFLIDFTLYLSPGIHTIDVIVTNEFLKDFPRRSPTDTSEPIDAYFGNAEIFIWEMHR